MFQVEKAIPIPSRKAGRTASRIRSKYPFAQMRRGDSFAVPLAGKSAVRVQTRIAVAANYAAKKLGAKFITRTGDKAVRCWQVG